MDQNEKLQEFVTDLSSRNDYLTKHAHEDEHCMDEYRKILEIEGLLDLYKDKLSGKGRKKAKSLYPKNDYSGLNSLRARLANKEWDGNPNTMPRALQKRNHETDSGDEGTMDSLFNSPDVSENGLLDCYPQW